VERFKAGDANVTVRCTACGASWKGGKAPEPFEPLAWSEIPTGTTLRREVIDVTPPGAVWREFALGEVVRS
jgi:hypothetical protein